MKRLFVALTAVLAIGLASAQDRTIELGYVLWDSEIASTHVVAAVLMDELGYDVELTSVDAGPMFTGLAQGDFDAIVAAWLPATHEAYMEQYGDQVVDLGVNLDGADIGWAVPAYVEVDSITELNANADLFGGEIIGIDPGAGLMRASDAAFDVYGLITDLEPEEWEQVLKINGFVASAPGFNAQPKVLDAASDLLAEIFGEAGRHARAAIGAAELPRNAAVEIEMIVAYRD